MTKRPVRPNGMPWILPHLVVHDIDRALEFYQSAFGFEKRMTMPGPDGQTIHGEVGWHDMVIMLGTGERGPARSPGTTRVASPMSLFVYCDDVDAQFARAQAAGAKVEMAPQQMFWGDRMCTVIDPDGYYWSFATNVADFDPSKTP